MKGFDKEWVAVPYDQNIAKYPRVLDGEYTFQIVACNNDGFCIDKPLEYHFIIDKPFYKKPWFWLLVLVGLICIFVLIIKIRDKENKKIKIYLRETLEERTKDLKKTNQELVKSNKAKELFLSKVSHLTPGVITSDSFTTELTSGMLF